MESYSALAASYDELTQDVGYEKRAAFVEKLFLRSHIPVHTVLDLACGTGTGAVVTVLTLLGKVSGRNVRVRMDGGELAVDAEAHDGRIENLYLTGPAALVCAGEILDKTILDLIKKQEEKA